jgi:hypothetical protein
MSIPLFRSCFGTAEDHGQCHQPGWTEDSVLNALPGSRPGCHKKPTRRRLDTYGKSFGTPADIGNAVALLCSDEANWITGQLIAVDGGASLMDSSLPLEIQQAVPQSPATQAG